MSDYVTKKLVSKVISIPASEYVGTRGDVWLNEANTALMMSDGETAGGVTIGSTDGPPTDYPTIVITAVGNGAVLSSNIGNVTYSVTGAILYNPVVSPAVGGTGLVFFNGSNNALVAGNTALSTQTISFNTGLPGTIYTVAAYAETAWGTIYSTPVQGRSGS